MDLITDSTKFLDRLAGNTEHFRNAMTGAGFTISGDNHPICPVMLGDAKLATAFADKMMGMYFQINYKISLRKQTINDKVYIILCLKIIYDLFCHIARMFLIEKGIYVIGFSYPVVPKDKARIRVQISAAHSTEDLDRAVDAFIQIGKEFAVI